MATLAEPSAEAWHGPFAEAISATSEVSAAEFAALCNVWHAMQLGRTDGRGGDRGGDLGGDLGPRDVGAIVCAIVAELGGEGSAATLRRRVHALTGAARAEVRGTALGADVPYAERGRLLDALRVLCRLRADAPTLDSSAALRRYLRDVVGPSAPDAAAQLEAALLTGGSTGGPS